MGVVIFDLDGTLVDSLADLHTALNALLASERRASLTAEQVRGLIGGGARNLLALAWAATGAPADAAALDRLYPRYLALYEGGLSDATRLFPGALSALDALGGHVLAVGTNKPIAPSESILSALGVRDRFRCVLGGDSLAVRKPHPAFLREVVARCGGGPAVMVGDSRTDFEAAANAGIPCVGVRWGYPGPAAEDDVSRPEVWISAFSELSERVEDLLRTGA